MRGASEQHDRPCTDADAGFAICWQIIPAAEIPALLHEIEASPFPRSKAGARHLLGVPAIRRISNDPRLLQVAQRYIGDAPFPFRATLFAKSLQSNWLVVWHQDTALPLRQRVDCPGWGPWSEKGGVTYAHAPADALERVIALRLHLDDSTATNGPLRVLPGTHVHGLLSDAEMQRASHRIAPVECVARAGSVLAMRPLLVHASSKATDASPRRVLHIEYAANRIITPGMELAVV